MLVTIVKQVTRPHRTLGKGKSGQSQGRKATGPRFLLDTRPWDPKIAGLPHFLGQQFGGTEMKIQIAGRWLACVVLGAALVGAPAGAAARSVDCDEGDSIQDAIDRAPAAGARRFEINVTGTCEERVVIRRDSVTIEGDATIVGTVLLFQATGVWLIDVTITGPGDGVVVAGSNSVRLTGVTLAGNDRFGLYIRSRGNVWLRSGTIIAENAASGVYVEDGSVRVDGAQIINNQGNGVEAMIATVKVERTATIAGNWIHGIDGNFHSSVLLRDSANITGNHASGVSLSGDSGLLTFDGANVAGNHWIDIYCEDRESSAQFMGPYPPSVWCTDFNY